MNKYKNTDKDIHARIYHFILTCFREVVMQIPRRTETIPIISQISASLTSIGANDREADASGSRNDFVAKYMIVKKETSETIFWLTLIGDLLLVAQNTIQKHITEGQEIFNIISSIILSTKRHS